MAQSTNDWKNLLGKMLEEMPPLSAEEMEVPVEENMEKEWSPGKEWVKIYTDSKKRKGKTVTVIEGIEAEDEVLENLSKQLKNKCGAGGSVKDGEILLQGDCRQKAQDFLVSKGFKVKVR